MRGQRAVDSDTRLGGPEQGGARVVFVAALLWLSATGGVAAKSGPAIQLFPTTVVEDLKLSASTARDMENSLFGTIQKLEQQMTLYKDSKCEGSDEDAGCAAIKRNLGETYKEMLDQIGSQLPQIKQAMESAQQSLGKRIRTELGRKMTPRDIQGMLEQGGRGVKRTRTSGTRQGRFSTTLSKYYALIKRGTAQGDSQAMLAANIYVDSTEALDYINMIQMEIDHTSSMLVLEDVWYGGPTDAMVATVGNVKTLLFGEVGEDEIPTDDIQGAPSDEPDYSDLEL